MLDAIGPYEVLKELEDANVKFVAEQKGEITAEMKNKPVLNWIGEMNKTTQRKRICPYGRCSKMLRH